MTCLGMYVKFGLELVLAWRRIGLWVLSKTIISKFIVSESRSWLVSVVVPRRKAFNLYDKITTYISRFPKMNQRLLNHWSERSEVEIQLVWILFCFVYSRFNSDVIWCRIEIFLCFSYWYVVFSFFFMIM